jgi:hypothetical protein
MATTLLLGLDDAAEWGEWLAQAGSQDVYFLPEYARVWESIEGGTSHLFVHGNEDGVLLYPFRLRSLAEAEGLEDLAGWFDITSDYGYGGPVVSIRGGGEGSRFVIQAFREFDRVCADLHVIAEFCRFHPLVANHRSIEVVYHPVFCNQTVWMDLTFSEQELWKHVRKGHRYDLRKAEKNGVEIAVSTKLEDWQLFYDLYLQTMLDVGASVYYHFSPRFFESMMKSLSGHVVVFLAIYRDRTTGASIFLYGDKFFHYHFSGMDRNFQDMTPNKLLLYRAALWAKERGFVAFHLGGGYSGSDGDSLMRFKTGFTKLRAEFYVGKRIHNQGMYTEACRVAGVDPEKERFFPAYRAKPRGSTGAEIFLNRQK